MIYGVYSIRDVKTGFMSPAIEVNDDSAARNFYLAISKSEGIFFTFPSDFSLYHIANFDSDTGVIDPSIPPVLVAEGVHALRIVESEMSHA